MEWTKYETHQEKMKTLIKSRNPPNQSIMASIDEIRVFIEKIHNLGSSYAEWLQKLSKHFYNPHTARNPSSPTSTAPPPTPRTVSGTTGLGTAIGIGITPRERSRTSTQSRPSRHSRRSHHSGGSSRSSKTRSPGTPVSPISPVNIPTKSQSHHFIPNNHTRARAKTPNAGDTGRKFSDKYHPRGYKLRSARIQLSQTPQTPQAYQPHPTHPRMDGCSIQSSALVHPPKSRSTSRIIMPRSPPLESRTSSSSKPIPPPSMNSNVNSKNSRSPHSKPPPPMNTVSQPISITKPTRIRVADIDDIDSPKHLTFERSTSLEFPPINPIHNIKPSDARRLSGSMNMAIPDAPDRKKKHKRKKSKGKIKKKKRSKKKHHHDKKEAHAIAHSKEIKKHKHSNSKKPSTPTSNSSALQQSPTSPYSNYGLQVDMMLYSASEPNLLMDYDGNGNNDGNGNGHGHGHGHSHDHHRQHRTRTFASKSKSMETAMHSMTTKHTNSTTESTFRSGSGGFPSLPLPNLTDRNSLRSFGELFSKQFQGDVAHAYKKSLQNIDDQTVLEVDNPSMVMDIDGFLELKGDASDDESYPVPIAVDIPTVPVTSKQHKIAEYFHDNYHGQNGMV